MVSGRRNKNRIGPLILENGESTRNDKEVEEEVLATFSELFNPVVRAEQFVDGIEWSPISFGRMRSWWFLSLWMKLRREVFGCDRSKSLGLNDFFMAFFQDNLDLVKGELQGVFRDVFPERHLESYFGGNFCVPNS